MMMKRWTTELADEMCAGAGFFSEGYKRCKSTLLCPLLFPVELCTGPLGPIPFCLSLVYKGLLLKLFSWKDHSSPRTGGLAPSPGSEQTVMGLGFLCWVGSEIEEKRNVGCSVQKLARRT